VRLLVKQLAKAGLEPVLAAQQDKDNFLKTSIPFVQKAVPTLYEYDIQPYLKLIEESVGAIGWRLHGNMIHLAHGNPAVLFSNCSRGDSFCDAFCLPRIQCPDHHRLTEGEIAEQVRRLLDPATFEKLPAGYREHRAAMTRFLETNGLEHNLKPAAVTTADSAAATGRVAV
jgi:polysaccharide pyruvyl transferase WcaK-like protein